MSALSDLIQTHPNWPSVTDAELTTWVNDNDAISKTRTELPNEQILAVILQNRSEFAALSTTDQQIVRDILYIGDSVPTKSGEPARDTLVSIFGPSSQTITALAAAISYTVSRAVDAGILNAVRESDVLKARAVANGQ